MAIGASEAIATLREVVLPGQPSYGWNQGSTPGTTPALMADDTMYDNVLPNRYTEGTVVGSNQVVRTVQQGYNLGTGYLVNNASGYAAGTTDLGKLMGVLMGQFKGRTDGKVINQVAREARAIVYGTCSVLHDEDEAVVEAFLKKHADFKLDAPPLRVWPHHIDGGGFFGARLVKQ